MKGTLLGFLLVILSFSAQAEEKGWYAQFGGASVHAEKRADGRSWNQENWGLGAQYVKPSTFLGNEVNYFAGGGVLKNSEFGLTTYLGGGARKEVLSGSLGKVSVGAFAGLMTYPSKYSSANNGKIFPVVLPTTSICSVNGGACIDGTYIPKVQKNNASSAVLFQGRLQF